jgi:hypothetical protein
MSGTGMGTMSEPMPLGGSLKGILPADVAGGVGPSFSENIPGDQSLSGGQSLPKMMGGRRHRRSYGGNMVKSHGGRRSKKRGGKSHHGGNMVKSHGGRRRSKKCRKH